MLGISVFSAVFVFDLLFSALSSSKSLPIPSNFFKFLGQTSTFF